MPTDVPEEQNDPDRFEGFPSNPSIKIGRSRSHSGGVVVPYSGVAWRPLAERERGALIEANQD